MGGRRRSEHPPKSLVVTFETMNQKRIRLLYLLTTPESLRFLRGQAAFMRERGFDVHVISSPGDELNEFGRIQRVSVDAVEMTRKISPLKDLRSFVSLLRRVRRLEPHIIHASTPKAALLGMFAAWLTKVPVKVFLLRNLQLSTTSRLKRPIVRCSYQLTASLADQVLSVSDSLRKLAASEKICEEGRIRVLRGGSSNGVDAALQFNPDVIDPRQLSVLRQELGIPDDRLVAGFVGRLATIKGLVELADAWKTVSLARGNADRLLVLGRYDENYPLPKEVKEGIEDDPTILLVGHVADPAMFYAMMDVVVLPSYREGLPNALLEAAAMRIPVVTTRALGCVDAIEDGVTGKLVPLKNSKELATAITEYLENEALRHAHGTAGRERVLRDFQQEPIWQANHDEFIRLLREKGIELPASWSEAMPASHAASADSAAKIGEVSENFAAVVRASADATSSSQK